MKKTELVLGNIKISKKEIKNLKIGEILSIRNNPFLKINDYIEKKIEPANIYINDKNKICYKERHS